MNIIDTIKPKSDQLNADDLMAGPITVTIQNVTASESEQPISVEIDGGHKPYKPCKSMRRVLVRLFGDKASGWIGKRIRLYCDADVSFGGVKVGGIRISHASGINEPASMMLTTTRSKRREYVVNPLPMYPADKFSANLPAIKAAIAANKITPAQAIERCRVTGELTDEQINQVMT